MISIVVVMYNMQREIERTLYSLSKLYQKDVKNNYEVMVIDNGSATKLPDEFVSNFGNNFCYHYINNAPLSPAHAVNIGVSKAKGDIVGILIDGARIITPGIIAKVEQAFIKWDNPVVAVLGYHLGSDLQSKSVLNGYDQQHEDELLESIKWKNNPYKLFDISVPAGSNPNGPDGVIAESNCIFLRKSIFQKMGGMNERFSLPGGGLVNLDFFKRLIEDYNTQLVLLKHEGSFHQIHGGIMSNARGEEESINNFIKYSKEYKKIKKIDYTIPIIKNKLIF
ncbi:MAG TPA: glycosyltransferase family A protein [bacterium]|nr:glycosyltransferase family A protein [bacterium]